MAERHGQLSASEDSLCLEPQGSSVAASGGSNPNQHQEYSVREHNETESYTRTVQ